MKVYLAGKLPKGKKAIENWVDWRQEYRKVLLTKFPELVIFDPDTDCCNHKGVTEKDSLFWFGRDSNMIKNSDAVVVQADIKLGAGTAQEMLIAKYFLKPVVAVLPKDTHHRRTNLMMRSGLVDDWIHPFINSTADLVVERLEDSLDWLHDYKVNPNKKIKNINIIDEAIEHFINKRAKK